jgi:serine O-acetyltransferase
MNPPSISADLPDWSRERRVGWAWDPGRALLAALRDHQRHAASATPVARALRLAAALRHRFWSAVSGAEIPLNAHLGGGLLLPHPNGVVIHPEAKVGPNCLIFQQVTLGTGVKPGVPRLAGHVDVGAGAKILGGVNIGAHARIGANAVVLCDVPSGATAVGVPAKVLPPQHELPPTC